MNRLATIRQGFVLALMLLALFATSPAEAHTGLHEGGFASGFFHPLLGIDHLLAMVAVGMLGVTLGGAALWVLPVTFVSAMIVGGAMGIAGWSVPFAETGIALSVLALGVALAMRVRLPLVVAGAGVALFAVMHGHAHGAAAPEAAAPALYILGFVLATTLCHLFGTGAAMTIERQGVPNATRVAGTAIAAVGVFLLVV